MALRWSCGSAFLCGEERTAWDGRCGRLCQPSVARGLSPAVAITSQPRAGNAAAAYSIYVDPSDRKRGVSAVAAPLRRNGTYDHDNNGHGRKGRQRSGSRAPMSPEKVDAWMRECVGEIVRNIGEAPLLVHVFSNGVTGFGAALRLEMEAADADGWPAIKIRWSRGTAAPPDGVILVEELQEEEGGGAATWEQGDGDSTCVGGSGSKTWGVVVQGWGAGWAACYILNTCRVSSASGFCTHFCLARAKCFEGTAQTQLKKAWLVGEAAAAAAAAVNR